MAAIKKYNNAVNHDRVIKRLSLKDNFSVIFHGAQQKEFILSNKDSFIIEGNYLILNVFDDPKNDQVVIRIIYDNQIKMIYSPNKIIAEYYIKFFALGFENSYHIY